MAMAALGVHIQPVFMTLVTLGLFVAYRVVVGPVAGRPWERGLLLAWAPALVAGIGLGIAAAQWLPLYELGRMSYRGPGLGYDLAITWPLRWQNLATIILPYLFRLPDGRWVTLWQQWESYLYVGILPLGLAMVGVLASRRRIVPFFLLLAVFGLLVGLAEQSPLNIHRLLWSLPGFSSLRAPGRYAYLIVFAMAGLAAFGLDALMRQRRRSWLAVSGAALFAAGAGVVVYLIAGLHRRLVADPVRWKMLIDESYLSVLHEHGWLSGEMVYDALVNGLSLSNPQAQLTVGLLVGGSVLLLAWALLPRIRPVAAGLAIVMVAGDLLLFGHGYHPRVPYASLVEPSPVAAYLATLGPDARVFADSSLRFLEPNTLLRNRVPTVAGYASLGTQRHFEYWSSVDSQEDALLDLWSVGQLVMASPPRDVEIVQGTAYRPYNALFRGTASNRTGFAQFTVEPTRTVELRVLSTLVDGVQIDQDTPMAEVTLVGADGMRRSVQLLAGVHTAENAYDRPDVQTHLRHARPAVAGRIPDTDPSGLPTRTNVYFARFDVEAMDVVGVELRQIYPVGHTRIFGLGLVDPAGKVRSVFSTDRSKFRQLWQQDGIAVLENTRAFPRAYVVPEGVFRTRAEDAALVRMGSRPFDGSRQVVLEEGPTEGLPLVRPRFGQPLDPSAMPVAASVTDVNSDRLRIATPDGPGGFLVLTDLYHRGWRARVDGQPAPVYLANFLFRAVALPPGPHTVELEFDPLSLRVGAAISVAVLLFAAMIGLALPWLASRRR
ncbi:MAG: YfhO family protein [Chloroflexi bacterium]|nr:YfhO family protein [Chloroflexota bacterium]